MERLDRIWAHPVYQECLAQIDKWEEQREFCRHTPEHFLDVARLTYLLALEAGTPVEKELVYAAGLLHDIGRHLQYEKGIPHEQASVEIAEPILRDCGYTESESGEILRLIGGHRTRQEGTEPEALFYRADKLSRRCFSCPAQEACDWPPEKKNLTITY